MSADQSTTAPEGRRPLEDGINKVSERIRSGRLKVKGSLGNLIGEAGKYRYERQTETPVDQDNHALAALRYMIVGIDRHRSVKDAEPPEPAEAIAAREAAEREERERQQAEWMRPENDELWL